MFGKRSLGSPLHTTSCSNSLSLVDSSQSQQWLGGLHSHLSWGARSSPGSGLIQLTLPETHSTCSDMQPRKWVVCRLPREGVQQLGLPLHQTFPPLECLLPVKAGHQYPPQNGRTVNERRNGEWNLLWVPTTHLIFTQPTRNNHCYPHFRDWQAETSNFSPGSQASKWKSWDWNSGLSGSFYFFSFFFLVRVDPNLKNSWHNFTKNIWEMKLNLKQKLSCDHSNAVLLMPPILIPLFYTN